jgi:short-subunit dehydrogenase
MDIETRKQAQARTILITGATAGIGRHGALYLARAGHHVIATGRNPAALAELAAAAGGLHLDVVRLDVTDAASIAGAVTEVERLTGGRGIDTLINNAGFGTAAAVTDLSDADVRAQYETNVFGLLAVTRAFLPQLGANRDARVINVSSIGGRVTIPFLGVYSSTKYAVESLSDALRFELGALGIRVVLVEPGPVRSNFSDRSAAAGYLDGDSAFAPAYRRYQRLRHTTDRMAADPVVVSRALLRAATARRPRARYVAPFSSRIVLGLARALPTWLVDAVLRRAGGLTPRQLRAGASERLAGSAAS